jgi:hypothetical protein
MPGTRSRGYASAIPLSQLVNKADDEGRMAIKSRIEWSGNWCFVGSRIGHRHSQKIGYHFATFKAYETDKAAQHSALR